MRKLKFLLLLQTIFIPFWLLLYFLFVLWFIIWNSISKVVLFRSDKRAVAWLRKHPGPFINRHGREVYVWVTNIEPEEPRVIGYRFWFELRDEPPPPDLETHNEMGSVRGRRSRNEPFRSRTSYAQVFHPHVPAKWNLGMFRDFIQRETPKGRPIDPQRDYKDRT